jgi:hypothetical protein
VYQAAAASLGIEITPENVADLDQITSAYIREQAKLINTQYAQNLLTVGATQQNVVGQDVVALTARIDGIAGWQDWATLFDYFGDGLPTLVIAAIQHFFDRNFVSGMYQIIIDYEQPVMTLFITGVAAVLNALPDEK